MGPQGTLSPSPPRVVLDTHTLISALLFPQGRLVWLRDAWHAQHIIPLVSRDTTRELIRVLNYPKFKLKRAEQEVLLGDFLPWAETVTPLPIPKNLPSLHDPDDVMFLTLAITAHAEVLVSGDNDLLSVRNRVGTLLIMTPAAFLAWLPQRA